MATYNNIKKIKIGDNIFNFYSDYLPLTGGQVTGPVTFGDAITIDEATIGDLVVNGSASFANNISANTINGVEVGDSPEFTDTTYSSLSAASGGTALSLVTTGEKYTWNNKSNLTIGTTSTTAAAGNHTHNTSIATSTGTSSITLSYGGKYSITAGGTSYIFTMPASDNTNTHRPIQVNGTQILGDNTTALNLKAGTNISLSNSSGTVTINGPDLTNYATMEDIGGLGGGTITGVKTTAGAHTAIDVSSGNVSFNVPTKTSHLTNDSGYLTGITSSQVTTALGYTPYNSTNPNGYTTNTGTVTKVTAGTGLSIGSASGGNFTTSGTINHTNSVTAQTTQAVYPIKIDAQGHISAYGSAVTIPTVPSNIVNTITTTAGTHTAISSKSGTVSFNVPTKTSHLTNDSGFLTAHQTLYEANLNWGGKDFSAGYSPIDAAMIDVLGANRFAFLKVAGLTIEYSTNGGSSYTDYGATDAQKVGLFSSGQSFYLGKHTSNGSCTTNDRLRVTIATSAAGVYTVLNKIAIYMSTSGATVQVLIEKALESTPTTYITHKDWTGISGWSGWNILNISGLTTYGNTATSQYGRIRFTFRQTAVNTSYTSANISKIMGFGGVGWTVPSTMAATGHLYSYDSSQNATFPAQITATQFNGSLVGNVTGNVSGTAGGVAWANVSSKPTATGSNTTGITASTTATKTTLGTAFSIPNVTSVGSASTWAFENITCDDITSWSAGSGSYTQGSFSGGSGSFSATVSDHVLSFSHTHTAATHGTDSHSHTAPSLSYTARTVSSKKSGANGSAPTLGTAFSVPNVTGNTSATVSVTDNGHTHTVSVS